MKPGDLVELLIYSSETEAWKEKGFKGGELGVVIKMSDHQGRADALVHFPSAKLPCWCRQRSLIKRS